MASIKEEIKQKVVGVGNEVEQTASRIWDNVERIANRKKYQYGVAGLLIGSVFGVIVGAVGF